MSARPTLQEMLGETMLLQCPTPLREELEAEVSVLVQRYVASGRDDLLAAAQALETAPGPPYNERLRLWAALLRRRAMK